jgi:hypothetical protein
MQKAMKPDGSYYYECVLYYVDVALAVSMDPGAILEKVDKYFPMKPNSIAEPDIYLGAKISKAKLCQMELKHGLQAQVSMCRRRSRSSNDGLQFESKSCLLDVVHH